MKRDEVYRRALRAAGAVTGVVGRRLAGVSLGICVAGAATGCLPVSSGDGEDENDGAVRVDGGAMAQGGGVMAAAGGALAAGGAMGPSGGAAAPTGGAVLTADTGPIGLDAGQATPSDAASHADPDAEVREADAEVIEDAGAPPAFDAEALPDAAAPEADMGPLIEDCLAEGGGVSDWRCCADHQWDRTVPGCEPCEPDLAGPPENWTECVMCPPVGRQPVDDAEAMEQFMCCEQVGFDLAYGCFAWGPPAPPAFDGLTLAQRLGGERETV